MSAGGRAARTYTEEEALARLGAGEQRFVRGQARFPTVQKEILADLAKGQRPICPETPPAVALRRPRDDARLRASFSGTYGHMRAARPTSSRGERAPAPQSRRDGKLPQSLDPRCLLGAVRTAGVGGGLRMASGNRAW